MLCENCICRFCANNYADYKAERARRNLKILRGVKDE